MDDLELALVMVEFGLWSCSFTCYNVLPVWAFYEKPWAMIYCLRVRRFNFLGLCLLRLLEKPSLPYPMLLCLGREGRRQAPTPLHKLSCVSDASPHNRQLLNYWWHARLYLWGTDHVPDCAVCMCVCVCTLRNLTHFCHSAPVHG